MLKGFNDLPKDVIGIVFAKVVGPSVGDSLPIWISYFSVGHPGCPNAFSGAQLADKVKNFALINKKCLSVVRSKCVKACKSGYDGWFFKTGIFEIK